MQERELHPEELANIQLENDLLKLKIQSEERQARLVTASGGYNGVFTFVGPVHEASVHNKMADIESYVRMHPEAPIEIILNSGGGSVVDGLAMVDYLKRLSKRGHHVKVTGYGLVASMAVAILAAADERVLSPRAHIGVHEVSTVVEGSVSRQEDTMKFTKGLQDIIVELLCERSELTPAKLRGMWKRKDVFINARDSLKLGLIDRIEEL